MRRGLGAVHGEIPATSAGMTEVSKREYDGGGRGCGEGGGGCGGKGAGVTGRRLGCEVGRVLFAARYPRRARV